MRCGLTGQRGVLGEGRWRLSAPISGWKQAIRLDFGETKAILWVAWRKCKCRSRQVFVAARPLCQQPQSLGVQQGGTFKHPVFGMVVVVVVVACISANVLEAL
jgi:hypothetical protein